MADDKPDWWTPERKHHGKEMVKGLIKLAGDHVPDMLWPGDEAPTVANPQPIEAPKTPNKPQQPQV